MTLDLQNKVFGRITILKQVINRFTKMSYWKGKCTCGTIKIYRGTHLKAGLIISCGCYAKENTRKRNFVHGDAYRGKKTPEYHSWCSMKARCLNVNNPNYGSYGGRGIKICKRWLHSYTNFLIDLGKRPTGLSLDRINNDGDYEPSNCRWATKSEQNLNRRTFKRTY